MERNAGNRVRSLTPGQIPDAAHVLAESFAEESLFKYLLGKDSATRARALSPLMRGMVAGHAPCSELDGVFVGDELAGVALTVRPDRFPISGRDMLWIALRTLPALLRIGPFHPGIFRLLRAVAQFEKHHPRDEPCWYLGFFGVAPGLRRSGVARDLARAVLGRADAQNVGCYLDTAGANTQRMCRMLGFQVRHELRPFPEGPTCWGMWRPPRGA